MPIFQQNTTRHDKRQAESVSRDLASIRIRFMKQGVANLFIEPWLTEGKTFSMLDILYKLDIENT